MHPHGVVLKVLVKNVPLGVNALKEGVATKKGTHLTAILREGNFEPLPHGVRAWPPYERFKGGTVPNLKFIALKPKP